MPASMSATSAGVPPAGKAGAAKAIVTAVAVTVDDFTRLAGIAGVSVTMMPVKCENVVIVQSDETVMIIRLPSKEPMQSVEDDLLNFAACQLGLEAAADEPRSAPGD